MQHDFAAPAKRHPERRDHDRYFRIPQTDGRLLKRSNHRIDVFPVALLRLEEQQHQIGADGEVLPFGGDHQRREVIARFAHAALQHVECIAADRIHFRVQRYGEHVITEIDEAGARIRRDHLLSIAGASQDFQLGTGRPERRRAIRPLVEPDRIGQLEWAERPSISPLHRTIDVVDRMRDLRRDLGNVAQRSWKGRLEELGHAVLPGEELSHALGQR